MRCISLWQPFASLWLSKAKVHETRHWSTPYRGPLAVHAAKKIVVEVDHYVAEICAREFGRRWMFDLPLGAVVGTIELIDCVSTDADRPIWIDHHDYVCGDFSPGRFGWKRGQFTVLPKSIPYKGKQGFFNVPDELVRP